MSNKIQNKQSNEGSISTKIFALVGELSNVLSEHPLGSVFIGLTGFTIFRYGYLKLYRKWYKLPDGPNGLPYFGIMPALIINMLSRRKYLNSYGNVRFFAKYYGNIQSFWANGSMFIQISDSKLCHELLRNKKTVDRPKSFLGWGLVGDPHSHEAAFVLLNNTAWVHRRKHAQTALGKVSTNKFLDMVIGGAMNDTLFPGFDGIINGENNVIGNEDDINNTGLWYPRKLLSYIAFRTIFHSNFGHSIGYSDELHKEMIAMVNDFATPKSMQKLLLLNSMKFTRKIPFMRKDYFNFVDRRNKCINEIIDRRLNSKDYDENNPRGYVDYIIKLVKDGKLTRNEMMLDAYLFFFAGSETTSNNLEYGIAYLCKNTDVQDRVRNELMNVFTEVNNDGIREFKLSLWNKCPLHRALVFEILRLATVVPEGVQHKAKTDIPIEYNGKQYIIPKNATIQYNTYNIHKENSHENWKNIDSENIHLENWLTKDIETNEYKFIHNDSHVTFGLGRRDCIGKHLAIKEMASVLGYMLLNYKFTFGNPNDLIVHDEIGLSKMKKQLGIKIQKI